MFQGVIRTDSASFSPDDAMYVHDATNIDETKDFDTEPESNTDSAAPSIQHTFLPTPNDEHEFTFQVEVYNDDCEASDEQFGFEIVTDDICFVAGNPDETYAKTTFTIQNDDGKIRNNNK